MNMDITFEITAEGVDGSKNPRGDVFFISDGHDAIRGDFADEIK